LTLRGPDFKNLDKWVWVPGYEAEPRNEKRPHSLLFCNYLPGYFEATALIKTIDMKNAHMVASGHKKFYFFQTKTAIISNNSRECL
jgi:hypothetical protein